jgi:hypothetical protein
MSNHSWKLVGPWYRWQRPGLPSSGRNSRPVFQKYDGPTLVADFLKDPQRSLKFTTEDFVHEVRPLPAINPALDGGKVRRLSEKGYFPTATRKLFLDTHKRFYLVVCELHCDEAGFPAVKRDEVCDFGFVIRRRSSSSIPPKALAEVKPILAGLRKAEEVGSALGSSQPCEELGFGLVKKALAPAGHQMLAQAVNASIDKAQVAAVEIYKAENAKLVNWAIKYGVAVRLQGWRQLRDGLGEWFEVDEQPAAITEQVYRLYPLIPDPRDKKHSARGRIIFFGTVVTSSADTDEFGFARFNDATLYEIRCFVRRQKPNHPAAGVNAPCCGEIVWSRATESYQLAPHFDLAGTSHRPVSMQLPDLEALQAQAAVLPANQLAPFRMVSPPKSNLEFNVDAAGKPSNPSTSDQICSFSIPLITIVATFVFKLFLPIVTLLFGLFFLLKLKFCIPPSVSLSADVAVKLDAALKVGFDASLEAKLNAPDIGPEVDLKLKTGLGAPIADGLKTGKNYPNAPYPSGLGVAARSTIANDSYQSGHVYESSSTAAPPSLTANLEYEEHVEAEVVA